ncbi:MAG: type II secretion system F family protein [Verrucomicrobiales bacterium]|nr:type II secretion system F family protein [Verrucomicrobiales bacterium]
MASFRYKVLQKDGSLSEGSLDAASRGEATRRLNEQGSRVLSMTEEKQKVEKKKAVKEGAPDKPAKKATTAPVENRLSSKQLVQFTEELSDLLSAGVQLDTSLHSIGKRSESPAIARVASSCYDRVRDGMPLATALRLSSPSFNELYCNLVSAGEVSGALGDILKRQVKYLNTLAELKGKLATALIYPSFLIVSGVAVSAMFTFFLIPKLRRLVESTGGELPPIARILLGLGDFMKANWIVLLVLLGIALVVVFVLFQREPTKRWWDEVKLKLPLLGKLLITRFNVQFVETLSNLLVNGLTIVRALELVETTTSNRYIREQIQQMRGRVSEGAQLNRCMEKARVFESGLVDMVRIGEDTGQLAPSMVKAGDRLDREFGRAIDRIASVIQPAIILVMSVIVGVMAYMMISVIYETISVLRNR